MNKRLSYIDNVAGIMIPWMILGHCSLFSGFGIPGYSILSFYMPWFFYKSGMFFKTRNCQELIKTDYKKFIIPFWVYSLIGWFVWSVCGLIDGSQSLSSCFLKPLNSMALRGYITGNSALWFLLSLFIIRQISNVLLQRPLSPLVLSIICFALAFSLYYFGWYNYSWWFGNIFSGMCFFLLGYLMNNKKPNRFLTILALLFFVTCLLLELFRLVDFPYLYMHANKMNRGNYILFYPLAFSGIILTNRFFEILSSKMKFSLLNYIGRNSMNFYVTHWILLTIVSFMAKYFFHVESSIILFVILVISCIVFLPLISLVINYKNKRKEIPN